MTLILPNSLVATEFANSVPERFLRDITRVIVNSYRLSAQHSHIPQKLYEKRYRTYERNGIVDGHLESVAKKHFNVQGLIRDNCTGSHLYTELIINDKVILTASSVDSPKRLPRPSLFRLEAAKNNPQTTQLDVFSSNLIHADFTNKNFTRRMLYGIILHGPSRKAAPEFIIVAIPDYNYRFHLATINLLERYSSSPVQDSEGVDLSVEEIEKPSAQLRTINEEYIEDEDRIAGEVDETDPEGGDETE